MKIRSLYPTPPSGPARWRSLVAVSLFVILVLLLPGSLRATPSAARAASQESVDDVEAPPETSLHLASFLYFGAEVKVEGIWATNLDLDAATADDQTLVMPEVALAVSFDPSSHLKAFLNVELVKDILLTGPDESPGRVQLSPTRSSSLDFVAHGYWQHTAAEELRDARLDINPTGRSRELGYEIDLIVGYEHKHQVKARWILGAFFPGQAFPAEADHAFFTRFEVEYSLGHP